MNFISTVGRQGADVAMLTRRLQERAGQDLQTVATSATMATGGSRQERKQTVAQLASRFFGQEIPPRHVVDETLQRVAQVPVPTSPVALRRAVEAPPPVPEAEAVRNHPLVSWAEDTFGLDTEEDRLIRRPPETFASAVANLSRGSGLPQDQCRSRLRSGLGYRQRGPRHQRTARIGLSAPSVAVLGQQCLRYPRGSRDQSLQHAGPSQTGCEESSVSLGLLSRVRSRILPCRPAGRPR